MKLYNIYNVRFTLKSLNYYEDVIMILEDLYLISIAGDGSFLELCEENERDEKIRLLKPYEPYETKKRFLVINDYDKNRVLEILQKFGITLIEKKFTYRFFQMV